MRHEGFDAIRSQRFRAGPQSTRALGGDDLVEVLFRIVKSQAAGRETDDFMTVPRSRPG
jgi:hypothetical protein